MDMMGYSILNMIKWNQIGHQGLDRDVSFTAGSAVPTAGTISPVIPILGMQQCAPAV